MKEPTMRPMGSAVLILALGLASCGGAPDSNLLSGPGDRKDSGSHPEGGTSDVVVMHDVVQPVDVVPTKDVEVIDTKPPPPDDTGPPDTGPKGPTIFCGGGPACELPTHECCVNAPMGGTPTYTCEDASTGSSCASSGSTPVYCDQPSDCPGEICCGTKSSPYGGYAYVACSMTCNQMSNVKIIFCNPADAMDVCAPHGLTCHASTLLPGFNVCG